MPDRHLVKRRWTDSSLVIKPVLDGDHTGEQYSTNGRTYTHIAQSHGHIYEHKWTHQRLQKPTHTRIYTRTHTRTYIRTQTHMDTHRHTQTRKHTRIHEATHTLR